MITAGEPFKDKWSALNYFKENLVTENYYSGKGQFPGVFLGNGWKRLIEQPRAQAKGIPQNISEEFFMALCDGLDPFTRKKLYRRKKKIGERRIFFDFTCSAFKSASLLEAGLKTEGIRGIHEKAAKEAIEAMEVYAAVRVRKGGQNEDRLTGNFIAAAFTHTTSRANDPQLHTHFLIFNTTYDPVDKCWKALQPGLLYEASRYATLVYQNAFIREMHQRGFEFVKEANQHFKDGFPNAGHLKEHLQIKGVDAKMIYDYSKRAQERDHLIRKKMEDEGTRFPTGKQISDILHKNRPEKTGKENQLKTEEINALREVCGKAASRRKLKMPPPAQDLEETAMSYASEHAFERKSVISEFELLESALSRGIEEAVEQGRGAIDLDKLRKRAAQGDFVRRDLEVTRQEIIDQEIQMMEMVRKGRDSCLPIAPDFIPDDSLDEEQRRVVLALLNSGDRITGFRGLAGTGKTRTLKAVQEACSDPLHPTKLLFCAPSSSAVDTLSKDGISNAVTLQSLLINESLQDTVESGVIVLDEAGLVGSGNMHDLFKLATTRNARVILSGDTSQHKSVPRGDALRILEAYSDYQYLQIQTIRRQREAFYRTAVQEAANQDPQKALDILDHKGWITASKGYHQEAAQAYVEALQAEQNSSHTNAEAAETGEEKARDEKPDSVIMTAPTWKEIDRVTEEVRGILKSRGVLHGAQAVVDSFRSLSWTQADKRRAAKYHPGYLISLHKTIGRFKANELLTVVGTVDDPKSSRSKLLLKVCRENGKTALFDPRSGSGFDVGEQKKLALCSGDLILLQANRRYWQDGPTTKEASPSEKKRHHRLINGTTAKIARIENGRILLTDGRCLPKGFRHFTHGYCLTSHTAQGKTAETVIVAADASSKAVNQEQFYVSISRGREKCLLFTNNKIDLRRRIVESGERKAGIELIQHQCITQSVNATLKRIRAVRSATAPPRRSSPVPPVQPVDTTPDIDL